VLRDFDFGGGRLQLHTTGARTANLVPIPGMLARPAKDPRRKTGYSGIMEPADIGELHRKCVERLKDLIAQANRTCSLLESMTEFPITLDIWLNAVEQRVRENHAATRYQEAREQLFDALRPPQQQ
jgi:hypothetical protein